MTFRISLWLAACACACASAATAGPVTIKRESVAVFADAGCMVKAREAKAAQLGALIELSRSGGCVRLKDAQGKEIYVMESALSARGPADVCKPKPGGAPVATDMAGVSAGGVRICP